MKLSEDLKYWRAERPDEWTMDRFIKHAEILERALAKIENESDMWTQEELGYISGNALSEVTP